MLDIPLMKNNIEREDVGCLISFLQKTDNFTNGAKVREFERLWSKWLGVKYSVFVNSGSSANFITLAVIKELYGNGEIIVPSVTWVSDIAGVMAAGLTPVFVDVHLKNLAMDEEKVIEAITPKTKAVFLTHVIGFNGLSVRLLEEIKRRNILLVEDVCESHGAAFNNKKAGTFGKASNFSFYYAHHMSTIEGGMICTDDEEFYQYARLYRSHGLLRETTNNEFKKRIVHEYPEVNSDFMFIIPGYNMRSCELNAVIGLNQLKRLDTNNQKRRDNFNLFLDNIDAKRYYTDFDTQGASNYAFTILMRDKDDALFERILAKLRDEGVAVRRGMVSGNMTRQPFVRKMFPNLKPETFVNAERIHFYGLYTGNYPGLEHEKIKKLCALLNNT